MTIRVLLSTQKELLSASVEAKGLDFSRVTIFRNRTASAASVSAASLSYTLEITGMVARNNLNTAVIEALDYRLAGDAKDRRLPLGTGILSRPQPRTEILVERRWVQRGLCRAGPPGRGLPVPPMALISEGQHPKNPPAFVYKPYNECGLPGRIRIFSGSSLRVVVGL